MYKSMQYMDSEGAVIQAVRHDRTIVIIEPSSRDLWEAATSGAFGEIAAYTPPPAPTKAELLATERAAMRCSPAQMRLALHRAGLLADIEAIIATDPEAKIAWEYATYISRGSAMIAALHGKKFTPTKIDDLFRSAMAIEI